MDSPPYVGWTNIEQLRRERAARSSFMSSGATADADRCLACACSPGAGSAREDDAAAWQPVVVDEELADAMFGTRAIRGQARIPRATRQPRASSSGWSGVIERLPQGRRAGARPTTSLFSYVSPRPAAGPRAVRPDRPRPPGMPRSRWRRPWWRACALVAPQWSFDVRPLEQIRAARFWEICTPSLILGIVAGFLLLMVALGLIGVLWQNVTRRTREIGLRRALGATRLGICRQILGELVVITAMALLVGTVLVVQLPLLRRLRRGPQLHRLRGGCCWPWAPSWPSAWRPASIPRGSRRASTPPRRSTMTDDA